MGEGRRRWEGQGEWERAAEGGKALFSSHHCKWIFRSSGPDGLGLVHDIRMAAEDTKAGTMELGHGWSEHQEETASA